MKLFINYSLESGGQFDDMEIKYFEPELNKLNVYIYLLIE